MCVLVEFILSLFKCEQESPVWNLFCALSSTVSTNHNISLIYVSFEPLSYTNADHCFKYILHEDNFVAENNVSAVKEK